MVRIALGQRDAFVFPRADRTRLFTIACKRTGEMDAVFDLFFFSGGLVLQEERALRDFGIEFVVGLTFMGITWSRSG